jgi:bifunctional DNase/RNase
MVQLFMTREGKVLPPTLVQSEAENVEVALQQAKKKRPTSHLTR